MCRDWKDPRDRLYGDVGPLHQCLHGHVALPLAPQHPLQNRKSEPQVTRSQEDEQKSSVKALYSLGGRWLSAKHRVWLFLLLSQLAGPACECYDLDLTARITSQRERRSRRKGLAVLQTCRRWGPGAKGPPRAPPAFRGPEHQTVAADIARLVS